MNNLKLLFGCLFVALLCLNGQVAAQQPADSARVMVETIDGNQYVGWIVDQNADVLVLKTDNLGEIKLPKKQIKLMRPVRTTEMVNGEYWPENPHATRYLFGPNGYGLRKGEGYYSNTWIFFNQISYGITNNFTLGAGIIPLFFFDGAASPIWITPKVSIPIKKDMFNVGVGGLFATVLGEDVGTFGVAYGQFTIGPRDKNINFGLGYGYAGDDWASTPTISISGTYRAGKKFAFITENYIFDTGDSNVTLLSFGGRFIGRNLAIDGALVMPTNTDGFLIAIPWLGINVPFGNTVRR
ncbi:MAG: hypothetical protein IT259_18865 [Saprospiraceae bacterium]|nr:hypothetical protein [Saprospiraceae bacterium]